MTAQQAYEKFIVKINKNAQTNNISCDKGRFVLIYNENQNKEVEHILEKKNEDDIRYIQKLLVSEQIEPSNSKETHSFFTLPENYFDLSTISGTASKDCCKKVAIDLFEVKADNENFYLFDEHNKPSFEFRESFYYLTDNSVKAFKEDFNYDNINLTYYKYPSQIRLKNEDNPEGDFSSDEIELDNKIVDRIISRCASDFELNNNNPKYQADFQRANIK